MLCGIDEAGRGPLAGPVCAAAVILGDDFLRKNGLALALDDSKKLSEKKRQQLNRVIQIEALAWGIGWVSHKEIDRINILQASLLAMKRAYENLLKKAAKKNTPLAQNISVIVDGLHAPAIPPPCTALVKADATVQEVMAASILAKCARDDFMEKAALFYPDYGYDKHKGYPTKTHRETLARLGPSPIQRLSFRF
ncbi:MAG: ribonuclease HII [Spirochaetes bacterium]|nr:ribonuclease HII [Spirochaetota bacterium]